MLKLKEFLPYRLSVISNRISRSMSKKYKEQYSLTTAEWRTVAVLGEESNLSAAEVAERTAMDKVAISRAVNNLLLHKRVERQFSEADKRRSVLSLSEEGRAIYEKVVPLALSYEEALLEAFNKDELPFLNTVLDKLNNLSVSHL